MSFKKWIDVLIGFLNGDHFPLQVRNKIRIRIQLASCEFFTLFFNLAFLQKLLVVTWVMEYMDMESFSSTSHPSLFPGISHFFFSNLKGSCSNSHTVQKLENKLSPAFPNWAKYCSHLHPKNQHEWCRKISYQLQSLCD